MTASENTNPEDLFLSVMSGSPLPMAVTRLADGVFLEVNEALCREVGRSREQLLDDTSRHEQVQMDPVERLALVETLARDGVAGRRAAQFLRPDSSVSVGQYTAQIISYRGEPCIFVVGRDVTSTIAKQRALEEAEARYRALVEQIPALTFMEGLPDDGNGDGALLYASPQAEAVLGVSPEELRANPEMWWSMVHPDDREQVRLADSEADRTGTACSIDYRIVRPDGRVLWVHEHARLVRDTAGEPLYWLGVIFDITQQRELYEEASRYADRFAGLYDIARALAAARSREEIASGAMARVVTLTGSDSAGLLLVNQETGLLRLLAVHGRSELSVGAEMPIPRELDLGTALRGGKEVVFDDVTLVPGSGTISMDLIISAGYRSVAMIPVAMRDHLIAVMTLTAASVGYFTDSHLSLAREIADQLAIALAQTELREQAERSAAELQERLDELLRAHEERQVLLVRLTALYDIAQALIVARSPREIASGAMGHITSLTGCDSIGLMLVDEDTGKLSLLAVYENRLDLPYGAELPIPAELDLAGLRARESRTYDDITVEPGPGSVTTDLLISIGMRSIALIPLVAEGNLIGILTLTSESVGYFTESHLALTKGIADQLAIALHQAELHQNVQSSAAELQERLHELRRVDAERRMLLARLVQAQEEERQRIANDIHDDSIQKMVATSLRLGALRRNVSDPSVLAAIDQVDEDVRASIGRLRHLMFELWPPALDRHGLGAALKIELDDLEESANIHCVLHDSSGADLAPEIRTIAFRITQEAIHNVRRHSKAEHLEVHILEQGRGLLVRLADDGKGFDVGNESPPGHLGLSAMRQRAEMADGWIRIDSKPGAGTTVEFWLPLDPPA